MGGEIEMNDQMKRFINYLLTPVVHDDVIMC